MDAKVIDAKVVEDKEDHQEGLYNFNFDDILDKESDYAFVQEAIECTHDNEVVLDLRERIVSTTSNITREKILPISFSTTSLQFI